MNSAEKKLKLRIIFKETVAHKAKADKLAMDLLYHPDATDEHLKQLHSASLKVSEMFTQIVTAARTAFPDKGVWGTQEPWNNNEFNRFYKPSTLSTSKAL